MCNWQVGRGKGQKAKGEKWECKRCGICCRFIVIPVSAPIDLETEAYLLAHGIAYDGKKLIIPAVCQYLKGKLNSKQKIVYSCTIHSNKFVNCRLGGERECKEARKAWALLNSE